MRCTPETEKARTRRFSALRAKANAGSAAEAAQFALQAVDVRLVAGDGGLHFGHAIQVLLVVALVALALGLAVVVFLAQFGQALFLAPQLGFEDAPRIGVARPLRTGVDTGFGRPGRAEVRLWPSLGAWA